jgi:hypothetical protein
MAEKEVKVQATIKETSEVNNSEVSTSQQQQVVESE